LDQEINRTRIDSLTIEEQLKELTTATVNFYLQINEKLQKDRIDKDREDDEKKELEKQKRFLDSVHQAELEDKEN
jgi:thymidylate kinase